jgi:hypothetical protein
MTKRLQIKKMPFDNFVDEGGGVKSSLAEESNNSMKKEDTRISEH